MSVLYRWVKLRSWHLTAEVRQTITDRPSTMDPYVTLCGRLGPIGVPPASEPDPGERTCERCFQIREADA